MASQSEQEFSSLNRQHCEKKTLKTKQQNTVIGGQMRMMADRDISQSAIF